MPDIFNHIEGPLIVFLIGIIAFFLKRLIGELDSIKKAMIEGFKNTNDTLHTLEKDLSEKVARNKQRIAILEEINRIHFRSGEDRRKDEMPTGQYIAMCINEKDRKEDDSLSG